LNRPLKAVLTGLAILLVFAFTVRSVWNVHQELAWTCFLMACSVALLGLLSFLPSGPVLFQSVEARASGRPSQVFIGLLGLWCAWQAFRNGEAGQWTDMALWIAISAVAWRVTVFEPLPDLPGPARALLLLGLFALAACFRLYHAGQVPVGLAGIDEADIWDRALKYVNGLRLTYDPDHGAGADGIIPLYMIMVCIKGFGSSILAFRSADILCGILMTGLFYRLAKDSLGHWAGLAAGFLWAVSIWPVTVTRANYYMAETLLMVSATMLLLVLALKKGGAWRFALAGLLWAFCFNVYPAARVMLAIIPCLYVLLWMFKRGPRSRLVASSAPLLLGFGTGLAPLLWWLRDERPQSMNLYFAALSSAQEGGILSSPTLAGKFAQTLSRVISQIPENLSMIVQRPRWNLAPHYFPLQYPIIHPWLFALAVLGAAMALARFRNAFYSFLLYWWWIGLLPALASGPSSSSDRRAIMVLPPTLLLAAVGADTLARWARAVVGKTRMAAWGLVLGGLCILSMYGLRSWSDYFDRNQRDAGLMIDGKASYTELFRALHEVAPAEGGILISTWRGEDGAWYQPADDGPLGVEFGVMDGGIQVYYYQRYKESYDQGGFSGALAWALRTGLDAGSKTVDALVLLTPFYDYLEPGLKDVGAELVRTVPLPVSSLGPLAFTGMAYSPDHFARIFRIRGLTQALVDRYAQRPRFDISLTELNPPHGYTRGQVPSLDPKDARYRALAATVLDRKGWTRGSHVRVSVDDPWFWQTPGVVPQCGITVPYSLEERFLLGAPEDGDYAFGASASLLTRIKVDHRTVFERDPLDPALETQPDLSRPGVNMVWYTDQQDRDGNLGQVVHLTKGDHILEVSQAMLNGYPFASDILRVVWRAPGRGMETLPLEVLRPLP
jgi:hypothetical protein